MKLYQIEEEKEAQDKAARDLHRQQEAQRKRNEERKRPMDPDDMFAVSK